MAYKENYNYAGVLASLANGVAGAANIQIESNADFICEKFSVFADIAGAVQTESSRVLPLCTLMITNSGSARQMMNRPVPLPALVGDGRLPYVLSVPLTFKANSLVQIDLANYSAATTYANIYVVLHGFKYYPNM